MTTEFKEQKIAEIQDIFPTATYDQISKILQYYEDDVNKAVDALTRDGGVVALRNLTFSGSLKSKKKKKRDRRDLDLEGSATASFDADDRSSLHSSGNTYAEVVKECATENGNSNTTTKKCSYCKLTLYVDEDLSSHQQKCLEKPIKCPDCSDVVALKDWYHHQCHKKGSEASEKLSHDFKTILLSGDFSDTVVKVKGNEFQLHRSILAARNPYFYSMFKNDMKEKSSGIVTIDDCEPDVFRSFIHFVYTGKVENFYSENVCDLYETADKYQEDKLKDECLHFMMNTLSVDNFCDYFTMTIRHNEKELFQKAIGLFISKGKQIVRTVKWQNFVKEYPIQANELFIKTLDHYIK